MVYSFGPTHLQKIRLLQSTDYNMVTNSSQKETDLKVEVIHQHNFLLVASLLWHTTDATDPIPIIFKTLAGNVVLGAEFCFAGKCQSDRNSAMQMELLHHVLLHSRKYCICFESKLCCQISSCMRFHLTSISSGTNNSRMLYHSERCDTTNHHQSSLVCIVIERAPVSGHWSRKVVSRTSHLGLLTAWSNSMYHPPAKRVLTRSAGGVTLILWVCDNGT